MEKTIPAARFGMPRKVYILTQGDLTLYNGTNAASEVSWIIVPSAKGVREGSTPIVWQD